MPRRFSRRSCDCPLERVSCARLDTGTSLPSLVRSSVWASFGRIEPDRIRQTHPDRHAAVQQAQVGARLAEPGRRELLRDLFDGQAGAARCRGIDGPRDFRVSALHPDNVHHAVDLAEHLLDRFGGLFEHLRIVAEDLDFDRRRAAFEIPEHVLQQLHELDLGRGDGLGQFRPEVGDDLL